MKSPMDPDEKSMFISRRREQLNHILTQLQARPSFWLRSGLVLLLLVAGGVTLAQLAPHSFDLLRRPAGRQGTTVVPDEFLRRWDPITIFFTRDLGPVAGGPADDPSAYVQLEPAQGGAWTWLDARTLQFKPASPWPPLAQFRITTDGERSYKRTFELWSLMEPPISTDPEPNATGLGQLQSFRLTFADPIAPQALAKMIQIELRPLPGVDATQGRRLAPDAWTLKALDRMNTSDPSTYVIHLERPVPPATRVIVQFLRALNSRSSESLYEWTFSTAQPFRLERMGCRSQRLPLAEQGSLFTREQALTCESQPRQVSLEFSAPPESISPMLARSMVRFDPPVENMSFQQVEKAFEISGDFRPGILYRMSFYPLLLKDSQGRALQNTGMSAVYLHFERPTSYVQYTQGEGVVERYGPQFVPLQGLGDEAVDLRIHAIDPRERSLWPFGSDPVRVDENARPPSPGEEPEPLRGADTVDSEQLASYLRALKIPLVSKQISLPPRREGSAGAFGLDIGPELARAVGKHQPGHYVVGIRRLNGSPERSWIRIQVTDLSLSTLEEPTAVAYYVTSLASGLPVADATVRLEGVSDTPSNGYEWKTLMEGKTDAQGRLTWPAPGAVRETYVRRIVVEKGGDVLVLNPSGPTQSYGDGAWDTDYRPWLQWSVEALEGRAPVPLTRVHLFSERPIYRPEEDVHIAGYVRVLSKGTLAIPPSTSGKSPYTLVVTGPGDLAWRYPVTLSPTGSFYHLFREPERPTGFYLAALEDGDGNQYGEFQFQLDAYRVPRFEVQLSGPELAPIDKPFPVGLVASFFAGGRLEGAPVRWRVSQFPYAWTPTGLPGFFFASDARYSGQARPDVFPTLVREDVTTQDGTARLELDPSTEATAQARQYVVEATVTGDDDQTVTATRKVVALPPFVVGVKVPRYVEKTSEVTAEIAVLTGEGKFRPGQAVSVTLSLRQWHSHLQAGDFSDGIARYITDVVDEKVFETRVVSTQDILKLPLKLTRAGVYVLEISSQDRLGRSQEVNVDFFSAGESGTRLSVAGTGAVGAGGGNDNNTNGMGWRPPAGGVFQLTPDKEKYLPGQTAQVVIQSPYQTGRALVAIEGPDRNDYQWVSVSGGMATVKVPIRTEFTPRFPVHALLMRGRVGDANPLPGATLDPGRPASLAATTWIEVEPVDQQVKLKLEYNEKALPGQKLPITLTLTDPAGKPLAGEVALWLVDQAVLSLGRERRLDPLPAFIADPTSLLRIHDTRGSVLGWVPVQDMPGGDGGEEEEGDLLDRTTVRKNLKTVPYFNPAISIGPRGIAKIDVDLPDNLTVFRIRAKVISGPRRFGFATGKVTVRLPVLVQPNLPRFVRPGDSFWATGLARIVEGEGGPGTASARVTGLALDGPASRTLTLDPRGTTRIEYPVTVKTPAASSTLEPPMVSLTLGIERKKDKVGDAFEVKLPVMPDRFPVVTRLLTELSGTSPLSLPPVPPDARPGTVRREVMVSDQPALVRLSAGLEAVRQYPYGCTEQKISRARSFLALQQFNQLLKLENSPEEVKKALEDTTAQILATQDGYGLVAFWPGSEGTVALTAWSLELLVEAKEAGFAIDEKLHDALVKTLKQALRSDYSQFVDGASWLERAWALSALARAKHFDAGYGAELLRQARLLNQEGQARVLLAFSSDGQDNPALQAMATALWESLIFQLHQGKEQLTGLVDRGGSSALLLGGDVRALAEVTRALTRFQPTAPRLPLLTDALIRRGTGTGWGSPNANAAALRALSELIRPSDASNKNSRNFPFELSLGDGTRRLNITSENPVVLERSGATGEGLVRRLDASASPLIVRAETRYLPGAPGSEQPADAQGFVVSRTLAKVPSDGAALQRQPLDAPGKRLVYSVGDVIEEHIQVVNPEGRHHIAVVVPLAAGIELLNPHLATAPPEATPQGRLTLQPTYATYLDDRVAFYFNVLPKGTYDFYFRSRVSFSGRFIQPGAMAQAMYDEAVRGQSPGATVEVLKAP